VRDAYEIRTPENVVFDFELAGLASRALAWLIDLGVMVSVIVTGACIVSALEVIAGGFALAVFSVAVFLVQWWYSALAEWWTGGRTVGKMVVGLRTLDERGLKLSFLQAVIRNLLRIVDLLPLLYFVGGTAALLDKNGRRLGDLAAGTIVVRERRSPPPAQVVPPAQRYNTFISDPLVVHAARRIAPLEREAMIGLSLRRERLPLDVRHELFARLATHLEARLGVPRPPFFSEEKYVLNLTAVVLASGERTPARALG
jgi:uncharacterized RDD family membrane protein YckC